MKTSEDNQSEEQALKRSPKNSLKMELTIAPFIKTTTTTFPTQTGAQNKNIITCRLFY